MIASFYEGYALEGEDIEIVMFIKIIQLFFKFVFLMLSFRVKPENITESRNSCSVLYFFVYDFW